VRIGHTQRIDFLNFTTSSRDSFTAVVFERSRTRFEDTLENLYENKLVKIRGTVTLFKQTPQIVVADPKQITVVDTLPEKYLPEIRPVTIGDELTIASYNVRNLFDDLDDPYHNDENTPAKPRDELKNLASTIRELNADVIALQEVESRGYLEKFGNSMLGDMGYMHIVHYEGNDGRGIDCSLLSRIPVGAVTSHRHRVFPATDGGVQRLNRDLLCIELMPENGSPFEIWNVHLKSNSGGKEVNLPIRLGECREIHRILKKRLEEDPNVALILCGDFNDTFDSPTLKTIIGDPPLLTTFFESIPEAERVTYNKEPYRSMIDFMLCSPAMASRYVDNSMVIRPGTVENSGSDHNPVYARFRKAAGNKSVSNTVRKVPADSSPTLVDSSTQATNTAMTTEKTTTAIERMKLLLGGIVAATAILIGVVLYHRMAG
ncbi:MAG: endonuclease/exonuclease/phosphatase family protein, partial [Planctomycetota bacterium]